MHSRSRMHTRVRSFVASAAVLLLLAAGAATPSLALGGDPPPPGEEPPVRNMIELFTYDGLLDEILGRGYPDGNPRWENGPPRPPGEGPDPDGIPHATVVRVTIDGPRFKGFFLPGLNRAPDFCVDPDAQPVEKRSRMTLEIWTPDPLDVSDPDSAVVLVLKSIAPDGADPTRPQEIADQLARWGISTVIWYERDDFPVDTTPHVDVVVANRNAHNFAFLLGDGTGALEPPRLKLFPHGHFPHAITSADLNADGNLDLALVHDGTNELSVRLGDGFGEFKDGSDFPVGVFPRSIAAGSLNQDVDGTIDLVVANRNSDDIHILFGDGTGDFPATTVIPVQIQPCSVVLGDFDEDSKTDIAVAKGGSDSISVLFGDGNGGFGSTAVLDTGGNPFSMCAADIDGDTHLDLVTANRNSDDLSLVLGNGDGTFQPFTTQGITGTDPSQVVAALLDGDSFPDLAVANASGNVTVLLGDGSGGFDPPASFGAGSFPNALAVADLDEDTALDLIVGNKDSGDLTLLLGDGSGGFSEAPGSPVVVGDGPSSITVGNFTDSTLKLSHAFGYLGDGGIQEAGFGWMVYRRLNKSPSQVLTNQELRFDLRFAYAQAYLIATTFFQDYIRLVFEGNPDVEAWISALQISYAGGSKRGGGVTSAVLESNILAGIDPRNVKGLFLSGYQGLDAGPLSGFHRYETDWAHTFDPAEIELFRSVPCPVAPCDPEPCPPSTCPEDSGQHPFKEFTIWAHRMRDEPQSYAAAYTPAENPESLAILEDVLIINAIGTHDWINPLGSHRAFFSENDTLDFITVQRINRNHGALVEMGDWSATEIVQMRALYNMRWANDPVMIEQLPLHRIRWVDLDDSNPQWTATIELETTALVPFPEQYTVWVAVSDDRDFRRNSDPVQRLNGSPCIDSDPNLAGEDEDLFFAVTPTSVVPNGNERVITFDPPPVVSEFGNPLVAVIVEGLFEGVDPTDTIDDLFVTTWPEFLNEDSYPSSISTCQGQDGENVITVNGVTGVGQEHTVLVDSTGPILFEIALPSGGGNGKFLAQLDAGTPNVSTITKLTNQLGNTCFPILLNDGADPVARFNSIGKEDKVGGSEYFGTPTPDPSTAPTAFLDLPGGDPANILIGQVFTLHGIIVNPIVQGPKKASITNAIVVTIN